MCSCVWVRAHERRDLWRPEASCSMEVELQVVVSYLLYVLGTTLRSSARALSAF